MKILIVIDVQNDFVTGALANEEAQSKIQAIRDRITKAVVDGYEIIFTRDTHNDKYLTTDEGQHLPVPHCIEDSWGWQIVDGVYVEGCKIIDKPTFGLSTFGDCLLEWYGYNEVIEEIEIIGFCTDICVISNALIIKAETAVWHPHVRMVCDASLCAGITPEKHRAALEVMKSCHIDVINE